MWWCFPWVRVNASLLPIILCLSLTSGCWAMVGIHPSSQRRSGHKEAVGPVMGMLVAPVLPVGTARHVAISVHKLTEQPAPAGQCTESWHIPSEFLMQCFLGSLSKSWLWLPRYWVENRRYFPSLIFSAVGTGHMQSGCLLHWGTSWWCWCGPALLGKAKSYYRVTSPDRGFPCVMNFP